MNKYYFSIAGFNFAIYFHRTEWKIIKRKLEKEILADLKDFLLSKKPKNIDYRIDFVWGKAENIIVGNPPQGYYQRLCRKVDDKLTTCFYGISLFGFEIVLRKILVFLLAKDKGFILHGSAVKINEQAYLFLGRPAAGKSTIRRLLSIKYPSLADDSVIIKKIGHQYFFYQTPFIEKESKLDKSFEGIKLSKVFFLRKATDFRIIRVEDWHQIVKLLVKQHRFDKVLLDFHIKSLFRFCAEFNHFYLFFFIKDQETLLKIFDRITIAL